VVALRQGRHPDDQGGGEHEVGGDVLEAAGDPHPAQVGGDRRAEEPEDPQRRHPRGLGEGVGKGGADDERVGGDDETMVVM